MLGVKTELRKNTCGWMEWVKKQELIFVPKSQQILGLDSSQRVIMKEYHQPSEEFHTPSSTSNTQAHTHTHNIWQKRNSVSYKSGVERNVCLWRSGGVFVFMLPQEFLGMFEVCTPQKSNIDTKNGHILKESTFSKPSFWVSMLVFGDVLTPKF